MEQVYLKRRDDDKTFIHHFRAKNGDKGVENSLVWWIDCGQRVENPVSALLERAKREEENKTFEHKKREPIDGSLVTNTIKYTRFLPKNQALPLLCRRKEFRSQAKAGMLPLVAHWEG